MVAITNSGSLSPETMTVTKAVTGAAEAAHPTGNGAETMAVSQVIAGRTVTVTEAIYVKAGATPTAAVNDAFTYETSITKTIIEGTPSGLVAVILSVGPSATVATVTEEVVANKTASNQGNVQTATVLSLMTITTTTTATSRYTTVIETVTDPANQVIVEIIVMDTETGTSNHHYYLCGNSPVHSYAYTHARHPHQHGYDVHILTLSLSQSATSNTAAF
ncbi:hypothetical protein GMORB2_1817 [Geosmithia morbida]|uniref:Uncharacterized protein n=1 Tax=Geosmithia morbida TaxID=1094350 RepID=A0A9P4YRH5_9HYPO|nr:uncharacterized protein GMORB2_1817 [Geosmithia morbida]KAF4121410.1 hypothetical protein GMORB2_1817 [Geosmithia morbida]